MTSSALAAFVSILLATPAVLATTADDADMLADQCQEDSRRLCRDVTGGWTPVYHCLQEHRDELSRGCRQQVAASEQVHRDCGDDVDRLCSDIYPVGGRVFECLRSQQEQLSSRCRPHVVAAYRQVEKVSEACADDVQRLCSDVRAGAGRLVRCLKAHEAELSKKCKATFGGKQ